MGYASARTVSLDGALGHVIDVQVDVSSGVVATAMVGRPDTAISESRDRCRAAVQNSMLEWPSSRRVTILLSPADLPKRGPHFDLAVAMPRPRAVELAAAPAEPSAAVRARVVEAREHLRTAVPRRTDAASELLSSAVDRLPLSGRGRVRVARVARTIAALGHAREVEPAHVAEALSYRMPGELVSR